MHQDRSRKRSEHELKRLVEQAMTDVFDLQRRGLAFHVDAVELHGSPLRELRVWATLHFLAAGSPFCCGEPSCHLGLHGVSGELVDRVRFDRGRVEWSCWRMHDPMAEMSGASIVEAMIGRYRSIRTYCDHGSVQTLQRGEPPVETTAFETAFAAPDLFRFAFDCPHPYPGLRHLVTRTIVGCDGARSYLHTQRTEEAGEVWFPPDLAMAVAGATGTSSGAAHTIARLLLPGMIGLALDQLRGLLLVGEVDVDGVACHRLAGVHPGGGRWELVIEKESLLLRSLADGFQVQQRRAIRLDEPIDAGTFAIPSAT